MTEFEPETSPEWLQEILRKCSEDEMVFPFQHPAAKEVYRIVAALNEPSDEETTRLPRRDRYVWLVFRYESQVMNGGVDQYLWNASGNLAIECLEALRDVGANASWSLLDRACKCAFGELPSRNQEERQKQLQAFTAKHGCHLDDWLDREKHDSLEVDLFQRVLSYWTTANPEVI